MKSFCGRAFAVKYVNYMSGVSENNGFCPGIKYTRKITADIIVIFR